MEKDTLSQGCLYSEKFTLVKYGNKKFRRLGHHKEVVVLDAEPVNQNS